MNSTDYFAKIVHSAPFLKDDLTSASAVFQNTAEKSQDAGQQKT